MFFDVTLLHRRKIAVEIDQRRIFGVGFGQALIQFAAPDQVARSGQRAIETSVRGWKRPPARQFTNSAKDSVRPACPQQLRHSRRPLPRHSHQQRAPSTE
jgi:hypothetical protein